MFDLTPKGIIFEAMKRKLDGTGIIKIVLVFNNKTDSYNVMLAKEDNSSIKLDLDERDISMIRKVLTNKIQRAVEREVNKDIKSIILQMDIRNDEFLIFTEDIFNNVELFNTKL